MSLLSHFSLVDYLSAFDVVISSTGVNSSNEIVSFGVPETWVPLHASEGIGQDIRAATLAGKGLGLAAERFDDQAICNAIVSLLPPNSREEMRAKMISQSAPTRA